MGDPVLSTFLLDIVLSTFGFDRFIHKGYKIPFYQHYLVLKRFRDRFKCGKVQRRRSCPKQTILRTKADDLLDQSRRSYFLYFLHIKADDPGRNIFALGLG